MCNWEVLNNKEIIGILIGDTVLIRQLIIDYTLPRMSGPMIRDFGIKIGYTNEQDNIKKTRISYMSEILDYVIKKDKVSIFFKELFDLQRYRNIKYEYDHRTYEELYYELISFRHLHHLVSLY